MSILITGAGGFVGLQLALSLLDAEPSLDLILTDIVEPKLPPTAAHHASRVKTVKADLGDRSARESLLDTPWDTCYLLHGIMSSGSEANLELGLQVNFDATRAVLDYLRSTQPGVKIVFTSSTAVYGPSEPGQVISEKTTPMPQSSYGTQKFMIELLLNDYSRRGLLDGRIVRLPTVFVRAGAPTAAASSFASGIVREPLQGEKSVLPVSQELDLWICSPRTVVKNLLHARSIPTEKYHLSRTVNLPGNVVSVRDILGALEKVGGSKARALVVEKRDEVIEKIVRSWPTSLDTTLATELGFHDDVSLEETVQAFANTLSSSR